MTLEEDRDELYRQVAAMKADVYAYLERLLTPLLDRTSRSLDRIARWWRRLP